MSTREIIYRAIIISFMIIVGFALAYAIYVRSVMGIILALISLGAGINFLYILLTADREPEP
jgi:hypothetical protein